ncbi:MAG: DUF4132 domain-containing protein [Capsulimonadaceae bacterium]
MTDPVPTPDDRAALTRRVLKSRGRETEPLARELARDKRAETASSMLTLLVNAKAAKIARAWLDADPERTIRGLLPVAAGRGRVADAGVQILRTLQRQGHAIPIGDDAAGRRLAERLVPREEATEPFPADCHPEWFQSHTPVEGSLDVSWIDPEELPKLVVHGRHFGANAVRQFLLALQATPFEPSGWAPGTEPEPAFIWYGLRSVHPLVAAVRDHVNGHSRDRFARHLFAAWRNVGEPSKSQWAMRACGLLGGDGCAVDLTQPIRAWRKRLRHDYARTGVDCLRLIGSDLALLQIAELARQKSLQGIAERAEQWLAEIAVERGLSREELEDRTVPVCGLGPDSTALSYGPREFRVAIDDKLTPVVVGLDGSVRPDLPKPNSTDDPEHTVAAAAEWKLVKKQMTSTIRAQTGRLEQAMVCGRRWTLTDFDMYLAGHPLMCMLARTLVWAAYANDATPIVSFRLADDGTLTGISGQPIHLPATSKVGVSHPLELTVDDRQLWGEFLADNDLLPPFPQIGRKIHELAPGELISMSITRFAGAEVYASGLVGGLESRGWRRGPEGDGRRISSHWKPFARAEMSAVVTYDAVSLLDRSQWHNIAPKTCYFAPGIDWSSRIPAQSIPLVLVPPILISEVLADLTSLTSVK